LRDRKITNTVSSFILILTSVVKNALPLPWTADHLRRCDPEDQLAMAFAAKSFKAVDQMQQQRRVSLCRVISGTLKIGNYINIVHYI
jgi:translation elongation factor EF-G